MALSVTINLSGYSAAQVATLRGTLSDRSKLHARIAKDAEKFVKTRDRATSANEHRSAHALGARPTGHLTEAYEKIQKTSDAESASLLVPRASRLRAAFGRYTLVPGPGKKFLTIPANAEAYGHRAREFQNLFPIRTKANHLLLCRTDAAGHLEPMYSLVPKAEIPEDPGLIPFDDLSAHARDSAAAFYDEQIKAETLKS